MMESLFSIWLIFFCSFVSLVLSRISATSSQAKIWRCNLFPLCRLYISGLAHPTSLGYRNSVEKEYSVCFCSMLASRYVCSVPLNALTFVLPIRSVQIHRKILRIPWVFRTGSAERRPYVHFCHQFLLETQKEHSVSLYSLSVTTAKPLVYSIFANRHSYFKEKYKLNYTKARALRVAVRWQMWQYSGIRRNNN